MYAGAVHIAVVLTRVEVVVVFVIFVVVRVLVFVIEVVVGAGLIVSMLEIVLQAVVWVPIDAVLI